jgi:deoxyribonuclease-4
LPYVINMESPDERAWAFARGVVTDDLRLADRLGVEYVVVHPGAHVGSGVDAGIARIAAVLRAALKGYRGRAMLLLEAMSGQGSQVGSTPDELRAVIHACGGHPSIGVCLDSCHQFSRGYDLRTDAGVDAMYSAFAGAVGADRIRCLHLNDCRVPLGSRLDRHGLIGRGEIGAGGIRAVVSHPRLARLPMCLETPVDDLPDYAGEIARVREIAGITGTASRRRPRPEGPRRPRAR